MAHKKRKNEQENKVKEEKKGVESVLRELNLSTREMLNLEQLLREKNREEHLKKLLNNNSLEWLKQMDENIVSCLSLMVEMLKKMVVPKSTTLVGIGDNVSIPVKHEHMKSFFFAIKDAPGWCYQMETKGLKRFPWTEQVKHHKWQTESREDLLAFLKSFKVDNVEHILEQQLSNATFPCSVKLVTVEICSTEMITYDLQKKKEILFLGK